MSARRTYLDYNATAPLRPEARAAMLAAIDAGGNPSSVHAEGRRARAMVERAREQVAALVGASPSQVIFTSGASEVANSVLRRSWRRIRYSRMEHPCVVAPILASQARIVEMSVDSDGVIDVAALGACLAGEPVADGEGAGRALIAAQLANNETGVIQPVAAIVELARTHGAAVMCDAVQAAGRVAIDFAQSGVDYLLVSSHKIGGPKGVGALVARDVNSLPPFIVGGGQERRKRAGTENVEGIAGFGAAAEAALRDLPAVGAISALRDEIERAARDVRPDVAIISERVTRLGNTTALAVAGAAAETLVIKLDLAGVAVSAGSACASGKVGQSAVLAAMGIAPEIARGVIRVSLGHASSRADVASFIEAWRNAVAPGRGDAHVRVADAGAPHAVTVTPHQFKAAPAAASMGE
ncbi:MAG: cysteine desulfurase [Hyphomicrobiaceae bacterium]|nr:cysteine desulfurase [Hyphomicrobiaceae bacterium]